MKLYSFLGEHAGSEYKVPKLSLLLHPKHAAKPSAEKLEKLLAKRPKVNIKKPKGRLTKYAPAADYKQMFESAEEPVFPDLHSQEAAAEEAVAAPVEAEESAPVVAEEVIPVDVEEAAPVVAEDETPVVVEEDAPVDAEEDAPVVVVEDAPVVAEEETPVVVVEDAPVVVEEDAPVVVEEDAPVVVEEDTPVVADETPVDVEEDAPVDAEEEAPVVAEEETPVEAEEDSPVDVEEDSPVDVEEDSPVDVEEDSPVDAVEEAPVDAEEAPVVAEEETPVDVEEDTPVDAEEAPVVVVEEAPVIAEDAVSDEPTVVMDFASVAKAVEEGLPTVTEEEAPKAEPVKKSKKGGKIFGNILTGIVVIAMMAAIVGLAHLLAKEMFATLLGQEHKPTDSDKVIVAVSPTPTVTPEVSPEVSPEVNPEPTPEVTPEPTPTPEPVVLEKYAKDAKKNKDMFGWVKIEGTKVDYPVMYTPDDPEKYLYKNFNGIPVASGTPFIDGKCSPDSDNLIIYGHNIKNGTMFNSIIKYENIDYFHEHPVVQFDTLYEEQEYEVMSVFYDRVYYKYETDVFKFYQFIDADNEGHFDSVVQTLKNKSIYDTGVTAEYGDQLIMLVTCAYHTDNGRFVVVARKAQ